MHLSRRLQPLEVPQRRRHTEEVNPERMCRKLREGDPVKFFREIRLLDEEEEALELREKAMAQLERLRMQGGIRRRAFRVRG